MNSGTESLGPLLVRLERNGVGAFCTTLGIRVRKIAIDDGDPDTPDTQHGAEDVAGARCASYATCQVLARDCLPQMRAHTM